MHNEGVSDAGKEEEEGDVGGGGEWNTTCERIEVLVIWIVRVVSSAELKAQ